ncbi:glycosyltransferase family 2 protein [Ochrovirga pacifica]|uniref:glycosyltransferase family 2 protein n=1 Tax=Ochrovirga pacifica TaxID=1042376 RepID=UPI0002559DFC|nr:glycosyltransferase family 2 protein [Ochrovirga pacifica]
MKTIAVLLTCFNRKEKTIACLKALFVADFPVDYSLEVFLVDDGCTDGTSEEVKRQFSEVNIIKGDGTLFWNRGMHTAWKAATSKRKFDFYLWLNDDTNLYKNALITMISGAEESCFNSIVCGPTCSSKDGKVTYGATSKGNDGLLEPNGSIQECAIMNGNCVLVPKQVYDKLGNLDWTFVHAIGDHDYSLRAIKAGFKNYLAANYIGTCEKNPTLPKWCLKETPIRKRFKLLYSPLGYAEPVPFFVYEKRHFGLGVAIKHFITINLRALIPHLWK